jgi:ParB-like chromosome segregation protein Spo0J
MPEWKSRIIGHGEEDPSQLLAHPLNPRVHPKYQQDVMGAVLDEIGWIDEVIVNRQTGHVVNGHLRVALAISKGEPLVPVRYVDLSPEDEAKALAVFDPIGTLAVTDSVTLAALLESVDTDSESVQKMLDDLLEGSPDLSSEAVAPTPTDQNEPSLASECLIEIRCTRRDLQAFQSTLNQWSERASVEIDIS